MSTGTPLEYRLLEALKDVQDPELPISIVDLGLVIYLKESDGDVTLAVTFTAMGCPGVDMIIDDVRSRLLLEEEVRTVDVQVVWDPIWTKARVSEDGKMQLRAWGISI